MDAPELLTATAKTMLYMRDGSFFQNPSTDVSLVGNVFSYLLKENEGNHAGIAKIQLVVCFNEGLENEQNFPTQLYEFEITSGLENKVAVEVMIQDWTTLTREARTFIDTSADEVDALKDELQTAINTANASLGEFDVALETGIVAANLAEKLEDFEEINNSRLLSTERQLADIELKKASIADLPSSAYTFKGSTTFASLPTTGNVLGDVRWTTDNLLNYAWTGTAWTPIGNGAFADGSVGTKKLADAAVTDNKTEKLYVEQKTQLVTNTNNLYNITGAEKELSVKLADGTKVDIIRAVKANLLSAPDLAPTVKHGLTYSVTNGVLSIAGTCTSSDWATNIAVWPDAVAVLGKSIFIQFYINGIMPASGAIYTPLNIGYAVSAAASLSAFGTVASYSAADFRVVIPKKATVNLQISILMVPSATNLKSVSFTNGENLKIESKGLLDINNYDWIFSENGNALSISEKIEPSTISIFDSKKLLFAGDSICYGANWRPAVEDWSTTGWRKIIQENNPNALTYGYASGGWRIARVSGDTKSILNKVDDMIADHPDADYIILQGGVNDAWNTEITQGAITSGFNDVYDEYTFCGAMESMLRKAILAWKGKKIMFITTHKIPTAQPKMDAYMLLAKQICDKWGIKCLDLYHEIGTSVALSEINVLYMQDGDYTHPNEAFYRAYYAPKTEAAMKLL